VKLSRSGTCAVVMCDQNGHVACDDLFAYSARLIEKTTRLLDALDVIGSLDAFHGGAGVDEARHELRAILAE
jgi:hypothetical protein